MRAGNLGLDCQILYFFFSALVGWQQEKYAWWPCHSNSDSSGTAQGGGTEVTGNSSG